MQDHYTLGIDGLTPSETTLVQTLLQLAALNRAMPWTCTERGPWHAVLLDDPHDDRLDRGGPIAALSGPDQGVPYILRLVPANSSSRPGAMARPIRAERLFAWLDRFAMEMSSPAAVPPHPAQHALPSATSAARACSAGATRWRLHGRPSPSVLRNDAGRRRMVALLGAYALNAHDLYRLTGVDPIECLVFLEILRADRLLSAEPVRATDASPPHAIEPTPTRRPARGLFGRYRT